MNPRVMRDQNRATNFRDFVMRYRDDTGAPTVSGAMRDLALRAVAPATALFAIIVAIGMIIVGPLGGLPREAKANRELQEERSTTWDTITHVWSFIGNTEIVIGVCVLAVIGLLIWSRQWWLAVVPAIAISLQATVFVLATWITDRQRPPVDRLDPAPPTLSFPSGHVGAATALYVTFAMFAQRIEHPGIRRLVTAICLVIPFLVAYARVYRGMHHVTDVTVGLLNGLACALLAWRYLRRRSTSARSPAAA